MDAQKSTLAEIVRQIAELQAQTARQVAALQAQLEQMGLSDPKETESTKVDHPTSPSAPAHPSLLPGANTDIEEVWYNNEASASAPAPSQPAPAHVLKPLPVETLKCFKGDLTGPYPESGPWANDYQQQIIPFWKSRGLSACINEMAVSKKTGELFFPSEWIFSPDPRNDKLRAERHVAMERYCGPNKISETRYVPAHKRAQYEADGWQLWEKNPDPLALTGIDQRQCPHFRDTMTAKKPWEETAKEFVEGIKLLHADAGNTEWQPGMMINGKDPAPLSSPSMADNPKDTMMQSEYRSATSMNHVHVHQRPAGIGAGWGEWDYWTSWQSAGRRIDRSMLNTKDEDWSKDVSEKPIWADADPNNPPAPPGWTFPKSVRLDPIYIKPGDPPLRDGDGKMVPQTLPAALEGKAKRQTQPQPQQPRRQAF
ncbi:hypothetical protein HD806DRAFT_524108 [Xylariaceae sp. AK1471]|nr:hypothetical protein HD806DRAFT_524108 [Xylariaceae sp. AK1471]